MTGCRPTISAVHAGSIFLPLPLGQKDRVGGGVPPDFACRTYSRSPKSRAAPRKLTAKAPRDLTQERTTR